MYPLSNHDTQSGNVPGNVPGSIDTSFWGVGPSPIFVTQTKTDPYNSDKSTIDTIQRMISLALISARSPLVISVVNSLLYSPIYKSDPCKMSLARAIYHWVKSHVRFVEDEAIVLQYLTSLGYTSDTQASMDTAEGSIDLLISPEALLSMPSPVGDCDDFSMLTASLLVASGIQCKYVAIAVDRYEPMRFSHVYVKAFVEGGWKALDTSHGQFMGWENRSKYRVAEWMVY